MIPTPSNQSEEFDPHMNQRREYHQELMRKFDAQNPEAALETMIQQNEQLRQALETGLGELASAIRELRLTRSGNEQAELES